MAITKAEELRRWGTSLYDGKWGYDRWEGPFVDDKPHGKGTMYSADEPVVVEFELFDRCNGC